MTKPSLLSVWQAGAEAISCGRSVDEQLDEIRKFGSQAASPVLRAGLLAALGIPKAKAKAANCVIFGCYQPFAAPFLVRDYLRVLALLGVDYTYLDKEYCCGSPFAMRKPGPERDAALEASREFNRQNLLFDHLHGRNLSIKPTSMGYFEGCHAFARSMFPDGALDWGRYRKCLGEIDGLRIADLPNDRCCKNSADELIDAAVKMGIDGVLCPCNSCAASLGQAGQGKVQMITLPELLLRILQ